MKTLILFYIFIGCYIGLNDDEDKPAIQLEDAFFQKKNLKFTLKAKGQGGLFLLDRSKKNFDLLNALSVEPSNGINLKIMDSADILVTPFYSYPFVMNRRLLRKIRKEKPDTIFRTFIFNSNNQLDVSFPQNPGFFDFPNVMAINYLKEMNKNRPLYLQVIIKQDSTKVKKRMSSEMLDSLRKNKIPIFHGELTSNKILIRFDDN